MKRMIPLGLLLGLSLVIGACSSTSGSSYGSTYHKSKTAKPMMAPAFGGPGDVARATSLWQSMRGYRSWSSYPGLAGFQPGRSPHGKFLKYYINDAAARNPSHAGAGYLIVKENYTAQDSSTLASVTVMQKIPGYDPADGDWFWVKFGPDGSIMKNEKNMALAGRVAKGMPKGCIACHANAGGEDFLFVND